MSQILYIFLCLFEFLCTIHYLIMTILISINSSYKDEEKMGWIVSVECIVQDLCRFKVFIFHSRKSSKDTKYGEKNHTWDNNLHGEHQNSFTRHLKDYKKLGQKNIPFGCMGTPPSYPTNTSLSKGVDQDHLCPGGAYP